MLFLLACLTMVALFSLRQIPLTADDDFYLDYFAQQREFTTDWLFVLADEPVFTAFTNLLTAAASADFGVRLLIALTLLPHMFVAYRLGGWRSWAYMAGYFTAVELAPHLSWVQLRQGFAVALLALWLHQARDPVRARAVAAIGLIHTSMLVLLPCFLLRHVKNRRLVYTGLAALSLALFALPDVVGLLSFALGRRENAYLGEEASYSPAYVIYCLVLVVFVTRSVRDRQNDDALLAYHAMAAIVLPMFFMTTFGAFAERLYFVVRWFELMLIVSNTHRNARFTAAVYLSINGAYAAYHSVVNFGAGGFLDRYIMLLNL